MKVIAPAVSNTFSLLDIKNKWTNPTNTKTHEQTKQNNPTEYLQIVLKYYYKKLNIIRNI